MHRDFCGVAIAQDGRPSVSDAFGVTGRRRLAELHLADDERETIARCRRTPTLL